MQSADHLYRSIPDPSYLPTPSFQASITPSEGFHRTVSLSFSPAPSSDALLDPCTLHALAFLPPDLFADPYELEQRQQDGRGPTFKHWGEIDLERPTEAVDQNGTVLLLDLVAAPSEGRYPNESVEFPLHLRYPRALSVPEAPIANGQRHFQVPWPFVFWACPSVAPPPTARTPDALPDDFNSPLEQAFDDLPLPFESPFAPQTDFHILRPIVVDTRLDSQPAFTISVPAGDMRHLPLVEYGTAAVVLGAFLYVAYAAWRVPPPPPRSKTE